MHPLYAFGTAIADPEVLRDVHWCIEGDTAAKHVARRLIGDLRGHVSEIQPEHKFSTTPLQPWPAISLQA